MLIKSQNPSLARFDEISLFFATLEEKISGRDHSRAYNYLERNADSEYPKIIIEENL
jgi:hypothetical protein